MLDKNELHDMLMEMQDYIFSKGMREICNELNSEKETMRQEYYKNVSAARGIYTPVPVIVMLTNDKLGRRVKKKETVLKEGEKFVHAISHIWFMYISSEFIYHSLIIKYILIRRNLFIIHRDKL